MTNKEISPDDVLDILFEHRNKAYGAYALRRNYSNRMQRALGISLGLALLLLMIRFIGSKNGMRPDNPDKSAYDLIQVNSPRPEKEDPIKPQKEKAVVMQEKDLALKIVPDKPGLVTDVPSDDDFKQGVPSDHPEEGTPGGSKKGIVGADTSTGTTKVVEPEKPVLPSFDAKFPGGKEAFAAFLKRYLVTPEDLETGEKKVVLVRFMVDLSGNISKSEIIQSGGKNFDKEVLRVLGKMPKWIPAEQNGFKVSSYFTQAVTFVAIEQ